MDKHLENLIETFACLLETLIPFKTLKTGIKELIFLLYQFYSHNLSSGL